MPISINGSGTITGISAGGLPDGSVTVDDIANGAVTPAKLSTGAPTWDSSSRLLVGTSSATANGGVIQVSNGVTFPAAQSACSDVNTLDDYEEGTWTPVLRGSNTAGTYELVRAVGIYTKIGRQVILTMNIALAGSITGGGTGYAQITGLPFSQAANSYPATACSLQGVDISTNFNTIFFEPITASSTTAWYFREVGDNIAPTNDLPISAFSANDFIGATVSYIVS